MGNTILGDDGAGIYAVRRLEALLRARGAVPAPGPAAPGTGGGSGRAGGRAGEEVTALALPDGRQIHLAEACTGGLGLVELLLGYERAVVIDAWPAAAAGAITVLSLADMDGAPAPASLHQVGLPAAMRAAALLGLPLPTRVEVWAIGVQEITLREACTPAVQAAVEEVAQRLLDTLCPR
ncbi:MAG: hydrogenase maturation protease [Bacillota bacterium]